MPTSPRRRMVGLLCGTGTILALTATPALAETETPVLQAQAVDESGVLSDLDSVHDVATDPDGNLVVTGSEGQLQHFDDTFEGTEETGLADIDEPDSEYRVTVSSDGDIYYLTDWHIIHRIRDGATEEFATRDELGSLGGIEDLEAGPDGLYVTDYLGTIIGIDYEDPQDWELVAEVDDAYDMHFADDTLYVATGHDVVAVEEPGSGDASPEPLLPEPRPSEQARDLTVDDAGRVFVLIDGRLVALTDEGAWSFPVFASRVEATPNGLIVIAGTDAIQLNTLDSEDDAAPSLTWSEPGDLYDASEEEGDEPGTIHQLSSEEPTGQAISPDGEMIGISDVEVTGTNESLEGRTDGPHLAADGARLFLMSGSIFMAPSDPADAPAVMLALPQEFNGVGGAELLDGWLHSATGEDVSFLGTASGVSTLDSSGAAESLWGTQDDDEILGLAADGDTVHVLLETPDTDQRIVAVDTDGEEQETFHTADMEDTLSLSELAVAEDGTYYIAESEHSQILRVENGDAAIIAGADSGEAVDDSSTAREVELSSPSDPMLDGAGNLYFGDSDGAYLLMDAANAPADSPGRGGTILASVAAAIIVVAGAVLLWVRRRTRPGESTDTAEAT